MQENYLADVVYSMCRVDLSRYPGLGRYNTEYNTLICLDGGMTTEGNINSTHLKFCCPALQTPSAGEVHEYPE